MWHFGFGGQDMERLVAGRERIYLDRFWNELSRDQKRFDEAKRRHYAMIPVHKYSEMSTATREALAGSRSSRGQDYMVKKFALLAIRLLVSVNLLYAAIFLKFAGVPGSVALFAQMSRTVHGLVSQPVFRLGSGAFETLVAVLLLIPKTARLAAGLTVVWMTAVILSHILVLGYGWFFVDALMVMVLAVIYVLLTLVPESAVKACWV